MKFQLDKTIEILEQTPFTLRALLGDLSEDWIHAREGEGRWTPVEIVAHLIHGEAEDWIPRTRIMLEFGEEKTFTPFEREGFSKYLGDKKLPELLVDFAKWRKRNIDILRDLKLDESSLARPGSHPTLGKVTLSQHLASWTAHDLAHINQITRVLAKQYKEECGPWGNDDNLRIFYM